MQSSRTLRPGVELRMPCILIDTMAWLPRQRLIASMQPDSVKGEGSTILVSLSLSLASRLKVVAVLISLFCAILVIS